MKDTLTIILYLCNWGPHTAFHTLQEQAADIPDAIKVVRVPCAGRINRALLLKAFELGADGVVLAGCRPGACRYGSGTETSEKNIENTRDILDPLGLGRERLRFETFLPDEHDRLLAFLRKFTADIRTLGKTPVSAHPPEAVAGEPLTEMVRRHDVFACQDCGKCTSACPLSLTGKEFSPRALASSIIAGDTDSPAVKDAIASCLTCGMCDERCPSAVHFSEFVRDLRIHLDYSGESGSAQAHAGFFQTLQRTLAAPQLVPRRWDWLPPDIAVDQNSTMLYWGGCAMFFDFFFRHFLKVQTRDILADSLRLLNFFDMRPALLPDERCCGHDLLWSGDRDNFLRLARLNVEAFRARGIRQVVTSCPECYWTLKRDYPAFGIEPGVEVTHLYELLDAEISKGKVVFKKLGRAMTFQDSCRLSRFEGRPDLPRRLIERLQQDAFVEMPDHGRASICCGNSAWTGCDAYSKALQVKRLEQARKTGSDLLVTSCPKCQIHLKCTMEDPFREDAIKMDMMDLTSVLARTIMWE
jgi:Fe-S oxidoreductase/coenzyme F420-reducing hydrogenase delta subunit